MGKIVRNGVDYTGLNVFANGVFFDPTRVIKGWTTFTTEASYTATEDCAVVGSVSTESGKSAMVYIDGEVVFVHYSQNGEQSISNTFYLKRGQTILLHNETNWVDINGYTVYGIQQGTLEDNPFEIQQISRETMSNVPLTGNTDNLYILSICDTYHRNSNRSYLHTSMASEDGIFYNSGSSDITDVLSDISGYSTFVHTWLIQTFKPNVSMGLRWWGNGYYINSLEITQFQVRGMVSPSLPDYSTTEHKTGKRWIDGKDIWEITITLASGVTIENSWTTIYTDALIGNIEQLLQVEYANMDNHGTYNILNYKPNGNNLQAIYPITGGLNVLAGANFTLRYTKT